MADTDEVKTISKRQQRLSLGEASNRKKERAKEVRKVTRTAVLRPNGIEWPEYNDDKKKELVDLLKTLLKSMKVPNRKVPLNEIRKVEAGKRGEFRRSWMMQEAVKVGFQINNYLSLRSSVALGVNCVSKGLETNKLVGIIIEKDVNPAIITKILVPLAEGKGVPIVAIDGLNSTFKFCCGMRCIAFGLKLPCAEITNHFYPIVELMQSETNALAMQGAEEDEPPSASSSGVPTPKMRPIIVTPTTSTPSGRKRKNRKPKFELLKIRKVTS